MKRWSSFDLGTGAAADCGRCSWWPEREKVKCPSHLASNPGDVLSFDLAFVSWWCNCCEKAAVACVCLSSPCTCNRNYRAAGTGPRLTRHQGHGALRPQPGLPTNLLHYHSGDQQPRRKVCSWAASQLLVVCHRGNGEKLQSCAPSEEPSWASLPSLPSGGLSLMALQRNKVIKCLG